MAKPITVTDNDFEQQVLKSEVPVIVDFWAPSCGPVPRGCADSRGARRRVRRATDDRQAQYRRGIANIGPVWDHGHSDDDRFQGRQGGQAHQGAAPKRILKEAFESSPDELDT